jgi:hypothetical protein
MKNVQELNRNELDQLKWNYFYDEVIDHKYQYDYPHEISDEVIFAHYEHVSFVEEDFFCNVNQ